MRGAAMALVLVDAAGALVMANDLARSLFNISAADLGRPFTELSVFYRPLELAPYFQQVLSRGSALTVPDVQWSRPGAPDPSFYEVTISPLLDADGHSLGLSVTYAEVTQYLELENQLRESNQALETAQEELQTTNEELQSTVEELETTNEELQSTNEELETMNEELQSTNEELRTSNDELRQRSDQLEQVEAFWRSVLDGHPSGVVVLDHESRVQVWTARAEDLWGLRPEEVRGKHFLDLDIGLPLDLLRSPLREAQAGRTAGAVSLDATNRRGKSIRCRVELTPLRSLPAGTGVLVLMQEEPEPPRADR
jgi:two-component system CheB/CheR fusion protein